MIRADVPRYDELQERTIEAIPFAPQRVLELGFGTGETTQRLLDALPRAPDHRPRLEPEMVFQARELGWEDMRLARMEDPLPDGPWDLVIAVLSVHHLDADGKRDLFRRVREQARALVIGDVVDLARAADRLARPRASTSLGRRRAGRVVRRRGRLGGRRPGRDPRRLRVTTRGDAMSKVLYEKRDRIAWVTINRPEARNAIDPDVHRLMIETWADFRDDDSVDVAILTGAGEAFCAGADLKTYIPPIIESATPREIREIVELGLNGFTRGMHRIPKPIVAAVNGWALAGGLETALACDIRIASERAMFGSFEARRGYHHGDGGLVRLVNACGVGVASHMLLTAEPVDAQQALRVGPGDEGRPARRPARRGRDGRAARSSATPSARCARRSRRSST